MKKYLTILLLSLLLVFTTGWQQDNNKEKQTFVLICTGKYAKSYHRYECKGLKNCKREIIKTTLEEAKKKGYKPCGYCYK